MRKIIVGLFTVVIIAGMGAFAWKACAAEEPMEQAEEGGAAAGGEAAGGRRLLQGGRPNASA